VTTDHWSAVHAERRALADQLSGVRDADAWEQPSPCPGWSVHDVLAHLVDDARTTRLGFAARLLRARLDFDRLNADGVRQERGATPADTLSRFDAVRDRTTSAPAPAATRLVEVIVHGEDIRRPLGLRHDYPLPETARALRHQLATSTRTGGGRERAEGLTLRADDVDLVHGDGPEVTGSALALLLAVSGRPVAPTELSGPGAARLRR
jgi:uncharacterized protein (TIGR03083 family)